MNDSASESEFCEIPTGGKTKIKLKISKIIQIKNISIWIKYVNWYKYNTKLGYDLSLSFRIFPTYFYTE